MSERAVATWESLPSLFILGMMYTITRYRDTTENSYIMRNACKETRKTLGVMML